jgi:hypothetical protein
MLQLRLCLLCDIINTHLFESKIMIHANKNDRLCESGRFLFARTTWL